MSDTSVILAKIRTVSTTQTTGELSLRYIPRPTPAPELSTGCQVGDRVQIRHEHFGGGKTGTIIEKKGDEFIVSLDNWARIRYSVHALEPISATSLLPCPGPVPVVPRPGPDTLNYASDPPIIPDGYSCQDCGAADRDDRLLGLLHDTYLEELLCFPV